MNCDQVDGILLSDTAWMDQASCHDTPQDVFFPEIGRGRARGGRKAQEALSRAKEICAFCPVKTVCLNYALEHRIKDGIWGGKSEEERAAMRRRASTTPIKHGTNGGYRRHHERNIPPCDACREAHAVAERQRKERAA
jgi:WhiB family redox-sensing transcriptional regulator